MKKTTIRLIAGFMAVATLLTGCDGKEVFLPSAGLPSTEDTTSSIESKPADIITSITDLSSADDVVSSFNSSPSGSDTLEYEVYASSEITQVKNKSYIVNGSSGTYTGDWKGNRPEGQGTFVVGETEYYEGTWKNGYLHGEGKILLVENDNTYKAYTGNCEYSQPSGFGIMKYHFGEENNIIYLSGDFSDTQNMKYLLLTDTKRLRDLGEVVDGEYVSYTTEDYYNGFDIIPEEFVLEPVRYGFVDSFDVSQKGEYFGPVNENGLPHGYGYLKVTNTMTGRNNKEHQTMYVQVLGNWDNGKLYEDATYVENTEGRINDKTGVRTYSNYIKKSGDYKNGHFFGNYSEDYSYTSDPVMPSDGITLETNIDKNNKDSYKLDTDGLYKTDYELNVFYYPNGKYGEYKRRFVCKDINNLSDRYAEGEYFICDKKGTTLDYGVTDKEGLDWNSTMPEEEKQKNKISLEELDVIGFLLIGGLSLAALIKFRHDIKTNDPNDSILKEVAVAEDYYAKSTETYHRETEIFNELNNQARDLREEAAKEEGYKRNQLLQEADMLEREASKHWRSIFW